MGLGFTLIAIVIFLYWLLVLQFEETTTDAYVHGNQILITPQISGFIRSIHAEETDIVEAGQILIILDLIDQKIAYQEAKNRLAQTVRTVAGLFEKVGQLQAEKKIREAERIKAKQDYVHREELLDGGAVSIEDYEHSEASYLANSAAVASIEHQLRAALAETENTTIKTHPLVEEAKDRVRKAYVDFNRCIIRAPTKGMIAARQAQVGEAVNPKDPLMTLVPLDQIWVNANYKETQLPYVKIGQPVVMKSDLYGGDITYHGSVIGLTAGTGSVFSVIPPQNATGNWIKIVQRLPVRIQLLPEEIEKHPLRLGLSMKVTVDTHNRDGVTVPEPSQDKSLYHTDIFELQLEGIEKVIQKIIRQNLQKEHG